jgi:hypothetical protein
VVLELTEEKAEKLVATVVEVIDYIIQFSSCEFSSLARQQQIDLMLKDCENLNHILSNPVLPRLLGIMLGQKVVIWIFRNFMLEDGHRVGKTKEAFSKIYLVLEVKNQDKKVVLGKIMSLILAPMNASGMPNTCKLYSN